MECLLIKSEDNGIIWLSGLLESISSNFSSDKTISCHSASSPPTAANATCGISKAKIKHPVIIKLIIFSYKSPDYSNVLAISTPLSKSQLRTLIE